LAVCNIQRAKTNRIGQLSGQGLNKGFDIRVFRKILTIFTPKYSL
jgi:hypothetical protein